MWRADVGKGLLDFDLEKMLNFLYNIKIIKIYVWIERINEIRSHHWFTSSVVFALATWLKFQEIEEKWRKPAENYVMTRQKV